MIKITIVAGTRPNFIKVASLINAVKKHQKEGAKIQYRLVHTGQHYDKIMSDSFFQQLNIPEPDVNLDSGGGSHAEQTAKIMINFEKDLKQNPCDVVFVVGDVNSTMACAIVAKKLNTKVAHVEAGIRSFDIEMPEEINRLVTDSITDYFFTTSKYANQNLKKEGVSKDKIFFVGNTMIDTLKSNIKKFRKPDFFDVHKLKPKNYYVLTLHRPSNVDDKEQLKSLLTFLDNITDVPVVFPIHPRTLNNINEFGIELDNIVKTTPQPYLEFNYLVKNSRGVITDSGGITEECTVMKVPCITLRDSTERWETVHEGTNELIGNDLELLEKAVKRIDSNTWKKGKTPRLWDGKAGERIITALLSICSQGK
jgi:UDP-N-acetylglucosamine 2-epimerase (non-hydrolysing)